MVTGTKTSWATVVVLVLGVATGLSCGDESKSGGNGESFTCQAICIASDGEVGGETGEYGSSSIAAAEDDCAADQARNADLCAGIGPFAGRCSCEE